MQATVNPTGNQRQSDKGYIPLPRTYFDHPLCRQAREYAPAEALLDLYRLARTLPSKTLQRGEFQISQQDLCNRWQWSRFRVRAFLDARIAEGLMVLVREAQGSDAPVWAVAELHQRQGNFTKTRQGESAPDVGLNRAGSQGTTPPDFKEKESTKEKETGKEGDSKEKVSPTGLRLEQDASINARRTYDRQGTETEPGPGAPRHPRNSRADSRPPDPDVAERDWRGYSRKRHFRFVPDGKGGGSYTEVS